MHKKRFYLCVGGNHFEIEGQVKVIFSKNMTDKFINTKSSRNRKLCCNVPQKYRKDVVLAAIFDFAHLKLKDTKDRILSDRFEFSTPKYVKTSEKNCTQMSSKDQCFIFQPRRNTHIFKKGTAMFSHFKIYMSCTN